MQVVSVASTGIDVRCVMAYMREMRMRTTLALDDDVLAAARALASRDRRSIGEIVSDLARQGLRDQMDGTKSRCGFPVLPRRGVIVTPELVNALRDEEE